MIRLEKVGYNNLEAVLDLRVSEDQKSFVAPNDRSLIEACLALTQGGKAFPFAICDGDTPVGFCMVGYGTDTGWEDAPAVARDSYNIWRFMIGDKYQGRGYGKKSLQLVLDFILTWPCGKADRCWLSYEPENIRAKALYSRFGFEETGEMDGDEVIAVRLLNK